MLKKMFAVYGTCENDNSTAITGCSIFASKQEAVDNIETIFADAIRTSEDLKDDLSVKDILSVAALQGDYKVHKVSDTYTYRFLKYIVEPIYIDTSTFAKAKEEPCAEYEIDQMITISTCHISQETAKVLEDSSEEKTSLYLPATYTKGKYGFLVYVGEDFTGDRIKDSDACQDVPDDLYECMKLAKKQGCVWLCFDRDAMVVDNLPSYDW